MNNETSDNSTGNNPEKTADIKATDKAKALAGQAAKTADNAGKIAESAGNAFSAIKWIAIAATFGFMAVIALTLYKAVSAPAKAVGDAAGAVSDTVMSGAASVKDGTAGILNRLDIAVTDQAHFNQLSEAAFARLTQMEPFEPDGVKQRLFWSANFGGHENKVCTLSMSFGGDPIAVLMAADNKAHAPSKALGSLNDRDMRILLRAPGDDVPLNVAWDNDKQFWVLKWTATTVKKPLDDATAQRRAVQVLGAAAQACGS